jgi:hypothetical protein
MGSDFSPVATRRAVDSIVIAVAVAPPVQTRTA